MWTRRWLGAVSGVVCKIRVAGIVHFPPVTRIKTLRTPNKAVFELKLMVGWGEHKVVLDEGGFRPYCVGVDWGLNFLSVGSSVFFSIEHYGNRWSFWKHDLKCITVELQAFIDR